MRFRWITSLLVLLTLSPGVSASEWFLENPEVFDLGIDPNTFRKIQHKLDDEIKMDPPFIQKELQGDVATIKMKLQEADEGTCHTQGLAMMGDTLFISCCFYPSKLKMVRQYVAKSFLLSAPIDAILGRGDVRWKIQNVTDYFDEKIGENRVTRVLGHPSGIAYDKINKRVLMANSVYDKGGESL